MGQQASLPKPGTSIQVIGAGLSRTGTASFSQALEILLNGPVYHCGTQSTIGPRSHLKTWISILQHWLSDHHRHTATKPPSSPTHTPPQTLPSPPETPNNTQILTLLSTHLEGYAAITDAPGAQLVPELLTLYPSALVICTTRDATTWEQSFAQIISLMTHPLLPWLLLPLPGMTTYFQYLSLVGAQWERLYGEIRPTRRSYDAHLNWLRSVVPEGRLVFLDVKSGWGPLCEALGVEVPVDVPFPHVNDVEAFGGLVRRLVWRGVVRWVGIWGVAALGVGVAVWLWC